jgi:hypothetical protein
MIHARRRAPRKTDETQTAENTVCAVMLSKQFLVAEAVLERQQHGFLAEKRRKQIFSANCSPLSSDDDKVAWADTTRFTRDLRMFESNFRAVFGVDANASLPGFPETRSHEKVNICSLSSKPAAVIKSHRSGADYADLPNFSDLHVRT